MLFFEGLSEYPKLLELGDSLLTLIGGKRKCALDMISLDGLTVFKIFEGLRIWKFLSSKEYHMFLHEETVLLPEMDLLPEGEDLLPLGKEDLLPPEEDLPPYDVWFMA